MKELHDILIGSRFYHNNYSTMKGHALPDYLIVQKISNDFLTAIYENHHVYTKERVFSLTNLREDSNLNPKNENPNWIFV